jgi:hypothetical protein
VLRDDASLCIELPLQSNDEFQESVSNNQQTMFSSQFQHTINPTPTNMHQTPRININIIL